MKFLQEIKLLIQDSVATGKEIIYFIILANLAVIFGFLLQGSHDTIGLVLKMSFITMFIPLLFTLRKHFLS